MNINMPIAMKTIFTQQDFLPESIKGTKLYDPGQNQRENGIREFLQNRWKGFYKY